MVEALLATSRLVLRSMTTADTADFHALVTRPEVARMLFLFLAGWTLAEAERFLEGQCWQDRLGFRLTIEERGKWVGWIGASNDVEPEVYYALRPEAAGRAIAQEAVAALSAFLFVRFAPSALTAGVFTDNPASARVLEKCGFLRVGEALHNSLGRLAPAPAWGYRLTCDDLIAFQPKA